MSYGLELELERTVVNALRAFNTERSISISKRDLEMEMEKWTENHPIPWFLFPNPAFRFPLFGKKYGKVSRSTGYGNRFQIVSKFPT